MAPMPPLGRKGLLNFLRHDDLHHHLPLRFGSPHATVGVVFEDGAYRLRDLIVDEDALEAFRNERFAKGESFLPEHVEDFSHPRGRIHAEGRDLPSFIAAIERIHWPANW